jgi:hypothetical protein
MLKLIARTIWQQSVEIMNFQKQLLHNAVVQPLEREVQEIQIPVPWGYISGDSHVKVLLTVVTKTRV